MYRGGKGKTSPCWTFFSAEEKKLIEASKEEVEGKSKKKRKLEIDQGEMRGLDSEQVVLKKKGISKESVEKLLGLLEEEEELQWEEIGNNETGRVYEWENIDDFPEEIINFIKGSGHSHSAVRIVEMVCPDQCCYIFHF